MKYLLATAAAASLSLAAAAPLHAESVKAGNNNNVSAGNLVNVTISDSLLENILNDLNIEVEDSVDEITVQAPIGVAATVCNVAANVLASDNKADGAACDAETSSQALNQIVKRQISG